jgi:Zn-dependent peptidase ImmA (M78 family)
MKQSKMERLKEILTFHQNNLCLDDWIIKLRWATKEDQKICKKITKNKRGFWGMVHKINYKKRTAEIVFNRDIKKPKEEEVMIHELFHVVVGGSQLTECRDEALTHNLTAMYEHLMECPLLHKECPDCKEKN